MRIQPYRSQRSHTWINHGIFTSKDWIFFKSSSVSEGSIGFSITHLGQASSKLFFKEESKTVDHSD